MIFATRVWLSSTHAGPSVVEPETVETVVPELGGPPSGTGRFRVILYNDDWHGMDDVIAQVMKATGHSLDRTIEIVLEAHHTGRAVCYNGSRDECHRVARVLREIRLQVDVDGE